MNLRRVFASSASILALAAMTAPALAADEPMETVVVTGIRGSMQRALDLKRNSISIVDAVSAEDIGKFPDKNIADALQRVPGVNTVSAAGGEGGFDENDRVSIRGTNASLTDVQVDGHRIATGDWFILDQIQQIGRSVSMTLLPSEIVSNVQVHKSQTADLAEGGVAGVVNIVTRKPLDLKETFTLEGSAEAAYTTLRGKTTPQFNALIGWRDDGGHFGAIVQAFYEARDIRRDGQEFLGYSTVGAPVQTCTIAPNPSWAAVNPGVCESHTFIPIGAGNTPELIGKQYPNLIGSALFLQQRVREGGMITAQLQPSDSFEIDVQGFYSKLKASNINNNFMFWGTNEFTNNTPTSYTLQGNTIIAATFPQHNARDPSVSNVNPIVADSIMRPGSGSDSYYVNVHSKWNVTEDLSISTQGGVTRGVGKTNPQVAWEGTVAAAPGGSASYAITPEGLGTVSIPGVDLSNAHNLVNDWAWTVVNAATDREYYGQFDVAYEANLGVLQSLQSGARFADHHHDNIIWNGGVSYANSFGSDISSGTYPSDFAESFRIPGMMINVPLGDTAKIEQLLFNNTSWRSYPQSPAAVSNPANHRFNWTSSMDLTETDWAFYAMANLGGQRWKGNVGVRVVNTREDIKLYVNDANGTVSDFGNYGVRQIVHSYWDVLPSANFSLNLNDDMYLRAAAAVTMARPDYSALGGAVQLTDLILTGSGGNPDLKPIKSTNLDLSYEWYYAPQSMVAISVFYMDLSNYVGFGTHQGTYLNMLLTGQGAPVYSTYNITSPVNSSGHSEGFEFQWEQPIYGGFGIQTNLTYADGVDSAGGPLVGDSKLTANLTAYYENDWLSTRVTYGYRSKMKIGLDRSTDEFQSPGDWLNTSVQFTVSDNISLTFDALNLLNRKLRYTQAGGIPRAIYDNGRQLYAGVRFKL